MDYEIRCIDVWSVVKIVFVISLVLGLIVGLFYFLVVISLGSLVSSFGFGEEIDTSSFTQLAGFLGLFMAIFIAILTAIFYSIVSAIAVGLYNLLSRWAGGIQVQLVGPEEKLGD